MPTLRLNERDEVETAGSSSSLCIRFRSDLKPEERIGSGFAADSEEEIGPLVVILPDSQRYLATFHSYWSSYKPGHAQYLYELWGTLFDEEIEEYLAREGWSEDS